MEATPTVFTSAAAVSIAVDDSTAVIQLTAPGFLCEVSRGYGSMGMRLRVMEETKVRSGYDAPLFYVVSGHATDTPICHFTSRGDAERLIVNICKAQKTTKLVHSLKSRRFGPELLKAGVEACAIALLVGVIGSAAANIGWSVASPYGARIAGIPTAAEQDALDEAAYSKQLSELVQAIPSAMRSVSDSQSEMWSRQLRESNDLEVMKKASEAGFTQAYRADLEAQRQRAEQLKTASIGRADNPANVEALSQALEADAGNAGRTGTDSEVEYQQAHRTEIRQHIPPFALLPEHGNPVDAGVQSAQY